MESKRTRAENMRLLHDTLIYMLNDKERRQFTLVLTDFQTRRDREKFVFSLRRLLNTPRKQEVVPYLLAILPIRERDHFLDLWMKTSQYNMFYTVDENKNRLQMNQRSSSYSNSYPIRQRQEQLYRKRKMKTTPQPRNSHKRTPISPRPISALSNNRLSASLPSLRSASQLDKQPKTHLISMKRDSKSNGFGFSIRGGAEHGLGIYVSSVEEGSVAERKNLSCGDQIIKLNDHNFQKIDHANAVKVIQQSKKLRMLVFSSSIVPGARLSHMEYQWVDTNGRPSSPPFDFRKNDAQLARSRSIGDIRLLQDDEERRVIVHVQSGTRLGLKIRGGMEYGLGIYVSDVDRNHLAEKSGIRAGDQIMDVNGLDFQEISHKEAVRVLKSLKMMSMILRHIGKIPHARTMYERTEWLDSARTSRSSSVVSIAQDGRASPSPEKSKFRQGIAGSQLLHQSTVVVPAHRRIEEQARSLLSDKELATLKYYISEYIQGSVHVEGLVISLFHLFDTSPKISLLNDVRSVVFPQDVDVFDRMVLEKEIEARESLNQVSPRKNHLSNGGQSGASRLSPKVPAKALSYKQLKSPKRQANSRVPWSPPDMPGPNIPEQVYDEPLIRKEVVQINHQAPAVIDDLDFEDPDESDSADDKEIEQSPSEFQLKSNVNDGNEVSEFSFQNEESLRRIIEEGMRKLGQSEEIRPESPAKTLANTSNDMVSAEETNASPSNSSSSPQRSINVAENDSEAEDIGFSLMRSVLLGFGDSKENASSITAVEEVEERDVAKEAELTSAPDILGVRSIDEPALNSPDDFGMQFSNFRPKFLPVEDTVIIRETVVSSAPVSPSNGRADSVSEVSFTNSEFPSPKRNHEDSKSEESGSIISMHSISNHEKRNQNDEKDSKSEILEISSLLQRSRIDDSNNANSNEMISNLTDQFPNPPDDLEFEYEDEPELAEPSMEEIDNDASSLKFAPIKIQETAPSSPYTGMSPEKVEDAVRSSQINRARVVNVYEPDNSSPRPFGFPVSSGGNRRQRYDIQDLPDDNPLVSHSFQNFSPRILNGITQSEGLERHDVSPKSKGYNDSHLQEQEAEALRSDEKSFIDSNSRGLADTESVLVLPDRSLTNKRIPIISYRTGSPEKGFRNGDEIVREIEEMTAANRAKTNENDDSTRSAFHSLRSIFEHQRLETPRTEYLSEIIKHNNEGRKRVKSFDMDEEPKEGTISNGVADFSNGNRMQNGYESKQNYSPNSKPYSTVGENDLSPIDDFDFSSHRTKSRVNSSFSSPLADDKMENSSGYGSEDYSPNSEAQQKTVRVEKSREELGLVLEASKKQRRGVQIKSIMAGELYAACMYPQLQVGQELISVDGEPLQGLGARIATISMKRAYSNPSGRFLEIVVKNQRLASNS